MEDTCQNTPQTLLATAAAAPRMSTAGETTAAFPPGVMPGIADVTLAIAGFVAMKVIERPMATSWQGATIPVSWIKAIVHVTVETWTTMEPRTSANKDSAGKPVWPIVAIRSAIVRCIVEVPIGARGWPTHADPNADLRRYWRSMNRERSGESRKRQGFSSHVREAHDVFS